MHLLIPYSNNSRFHAYFLIAVLIIWIFSILGTILGLFYYIPYSLFFEKKIIEALDDYFVYTHSFRKKKCFYRDITRLEATIYPKGISVDIKLNDSSHFCCTSSITIESLEKLRERVDFEIVIEDIYKMLPD